MDFMTPEKRSRHMAKISSRDTGPEIAVRRMLHAEGYRYRLHGRIAAALLARIRRQHPELRLRGGRLPGSPDLVFGTRKKAIFVNGCFWHGHACPVGAHRPRSNQDFWNAKLDRNIERDRNNRNDLKTLGWSYLDIWECELSTPSAVLLRVHEFLDPAR